ncbi:hypothetical protein NDN08_004430 [Rhodosorus marinus]|uniref:GATA-type domain-containing protein n=1 Tax=Rhodosorus marinus TaxID=101924 RepID=A0AAV8UQD1_9RHOD|nr:hypothetical protein NDN08_004430 [Rhodosorus marinus]
MVALEMEDERRCVHCGTSKTPMWRCGPKGSKSLCNACGIRWKKGRGDDGDRAARTGSDEVKLRGLIRKMKKKQAKKKKNKRARTVVRETETALMRCQSDPTPDFIDVFNYRCLFPGLMVVDKERGF